MSGVRILFFKAWWKFTRIHQYYTMALIRFEIITLRLIYMLLADWACFEYSYDSIDLMHMTSQKGAPACWGSNEALSRAPSPSMQPGGPTPACHTAGTARARALTKSREAESANALPAQHVVRSATSLDPHHGVVAMETWRQCIRSIVSTVPYEPCDGFVEITVIHILRN